jgi:hypothetical protein
MGLGSGIRNNLFRIPDPGPEVKKASDPESGALQKSLDFQGPTL